MNKAPPSPELCSTAEEIAREYYRSALAGSKDLVKFLQTDEELIDDIVSDLISRPDGEFAQMYKPRLLEFCRARALRLLKKMIAEESLPIRRSKNNG